MQYKRGKGFDSIVHLDNLLRLIHSFVIWVRIHLGLRIVSELFLPNSREPEDDRLLARSCCIHDGQGRAAGNLLVLK
jgi:hypothetical protein